MNIAENTQQKQNKTNNKNQIRIQLGEWKYDAFVTNTGAQKRQQEKSERAG